MLCPHQIMAVPDQRLLPKQTETTTTWREFGNAIVHAYRQYLEDKTKTLWIIVQLPLEPFSMLTSSV